MLSPVGLLKQKLTKLWEEYDDIWDKLAELSTVSVRGSKWSQTWVELGNKNDAIVREIELVQFMIPIEEGYCLMWKHLTGETQESFMHSRAFGAELFA